MLATESSSVLVMDDQIEVCRLAVQQLERIGLRAQGVCTKPELISALDQLPPDLLLLDLSLGDSDAVEIFQMLSQRSFAGCVILMSGHGGAVLEHARRIGQRSGITIGGVLRKPFRQKDLRDLLFSKSAPAVGDEDEEISSDDPTLLQQALREKWLEFWYQPKIELKHLEVIGAEGLARIRHPERGILSPAAFLPGAGTDALHALTMQAVEDAFAMGRRLEGLLPEPRLSINLAGRTLHHPALLDQLKGIRDRAESPARLTLEITESDVIEDTEAAQEFATRAVLHGFAVSIDDFGSGYSTFERLRHIPFSELKLERTVVKGCASDRQLRSICQAAVQLGHDFEAEVVGEGVEGAADLETLRELGFDLVQGFYFSRPLPVDDFLGYVQNRQNR
ncbi:EAL domain-containing response regulator [Fodinicurvata fenggangensis]|uniref:EAL domain-containing response regulator n=1 Tax=Fodinicurvata fenggangensis TaxID=1121830 RepID=UPI00068B458A|nr:EAL domain-containing response regulator [Fodinicurvata fenggangensis]